MRRLLKSVALLTLLAISSPLLAQNVAITNTMLASGDGSEPIAGATVVVRNGQVVAAGTGIAVPADIQTLDGTGKWVTPGLFIAVTDLGLSDVSAVYQSNDREADQSIFNAALDVSPALNPASQHVLVSRVGGITRASVTPDAGNAIFAGQGAIVHLGSQDAMIVRPRAFQYVELGEGGAALAGGSRTAAHTTLHNALAEAKAYLAGRWTGDGALLTRMDAKALGPVISGAQKLYVRAERASDIRAVLALKQTYPQLEMVLVGASEGWLVANEIAAANVPVVAKALNDLPAQFEQIAATQSNIGRMVDAGVKVAIGYFSGIEQPRNAPFHAGNLVALNKVPGATGLSWGEALATITSVPAEISGMGGKLGVLKPGAIGDLVLWDGDPLEVSSAPLKVFVAGVEQPLENHQTRLRERYRDLDESDLPKAFDW